MISKKLALTRLPVDGSLFNGLQSIDRWQQYFDHPNGVKLGLMSSAGFLPGIIAGFVGDRIGTYLGRKLTLWIGTIISVRTSVKLTFEVGTNLSRLRAQLFYHSQLPTACSVPVVLSPDSATASLLMSLLHCSWNSHIPDIVVRLAPSVSMRITCLPRKSPKLCSDTCVYYLSAILSAAACLGCLNLEGNKSWRVPCFLQLVGPGVTLLMTSTVPESPRVRHLP